MGTESDGNPGKVCRAADAIPQGGPANTSLSDLSRPWATVDCPRGLRFQVRSDWLPRLFDTGEWPWARWLREGRVQVVKSGRHRTVYRVDLAQQSIFVKHYHPPEALARLRSLVRPVASRREWQMSEKLRRLGIPTLVPLAVGQQRQLGMVHDHYFVTAGVSGSHTLDRYLQEVLPRFSPVEQVAVRRHLLAAAGQLIAAGHRVGVSHGDLHLGNLLVQLDSDQRPVSQESAEPVLRLIDLPEASVKSPLTWRASCHNLAQLASAAREITTPREKLCFWRKYLDARPDLNLCESHARRAAARQLEKVAWSYARRLARSRDKRSWQTNRDFVVINSATWKGWMLAEVASDVTSRLPSECVAAADLASLPWNCDGGHPVGCADGRTVLARGQWQVGATSRKALRELQHELPARRWYAAHALVARGIRTPRPLACLAYQSPSTSGMWLLIEHRSDLQPLSHMLAAGGPLREAVKAREVAGAVGTLVGRLHAWGFTHAQLSLDALSVNLSGNRPEAWLLLCDGLSQPRWVSRRRLLRDLQPLAAALRYTPDVSASLLLRGLRAWLKSAGYPVAQWRWWWRRLAASSAQSPAGVP